MAAGGGDGCPALDTGLCGVRSPWPVPTGGYLLLSHDGCQLWYLDAGGIIHLLLNGATGRTHTGDGLFFTGLYGVWDVAELRLWSRVLSQSELAANMYRARTGSEAGLNAYYTFKNTTRDITGHGNDGILMYMEQYLQQNVLRSSPEGALSLLLLEN